jgi:spermidine/putrescine transport system permease protein
LSARGGRRRDLIAYALIIPGLLWLIVFFAIPMGSMAQYSLASGRFPDFTFSIAEPNFDNYTDMLSQYWSPQFVRSIVYGLIVTVMTLVISYPMMYWIAFRGGRRKNLYLLLILLPFFTPFLIRTLMWKFVLADQGFFLAFLKDLGIVGEGFRFLSTSAAVIGGMVYNFLPFMALPLYVALERMDHSMIDAAQDLYSSPRQTFWKVTFPLSLPGVFAGSLLTFIPSVGDFIDAELLGGTNTTMIGNVIQREFLINRDYADGSAMSLLLMIGILVGVFLYTRALGTEELTG